jgi:hypothetical protein
MDFSFVYKKGKWAGGSCGRFELYDRYDQVAVDVFKNLEGK